MPSGRPGPPPAQPRTRLQPLQLPVQHRYLVPLARNGSALNKCRGGQARSPDKKDEGYFFFKPYSQALPGNNFAFVCIDLQNKQG